MRITRKLLLTLVALLLLAIAGGTLLKVSTNRTIERAEALQFRRLLLAQQGEDRDYRFFFATNRQPLNGGGAVDELFGNQRMDSLNFGFFDTAIEPSLGIGMLINPTDWFQNEEIQLRQVRSLDQQAFLEELRRQVRASPYQAVLVNVNGFRERFPSALRKTAFLAHVLDIDAPLLVFDWPGDQGSSPRG